MKATAALRRVNVLNIFSIYTLISFSQTCPQPLQRECTFLPKCRTENSPKRVLNFSKHKQQESLVKLHKFRTERRTCHISIKPNPEILFKKWFLLMIRDQQELMLPKICCCLIRYYEHKEVISSWREAHAKFQGWGRHPLPASRHSYAAHPSSMLSR